MTRLYSIIRQVTVARGIDMCWPFVSEPTHLAGWFADVGGELVPPGRCRFDIGDGDYFDAQILRRDPPRCLGLTWRFMGVGTESLVELHLLPRGGRTEISVIDRGEYSDADAGALADGWEDFLSRLALHLHSGSRTRFRWSETIGAGAVVALDVDDLRLAIRDEARWRRAFPEASVRLRLERDGASLVVCEPPWQAVETRACLSAGAGRTGSRLSVVHEGWTSLGEDIRYDTRARYAARWAATLADLETTFGRPDERAATGAYARVAATAER